MLFQPLVHIRQEEYKLILVDEVFIRKKKDENNFIGRWQNNRETLSGCY